MASAGLALSGGLAWGGCFQATSRAWLATVAFVPILLLLGRRGAVRWAFAAGVLSWWLTMPWIATTLETFGQLPKAVAFGLFVLLSCVLGADFALFAWLGERLWHRGGVWPILGLPSLWVVIEQARGFFVHGFPWNLAAYAWTDWPAALGLGPWIGAAGVSWCVIALNTGLALTVSTRRLGGALAVVLAIAALLAVGSRNVDSPAAAGPGVALRIVQPNNPMSSDETTLLAGYANLLELSREACDEPALIVWPESAAWPFGWQTTPRLRADVAALARAGCPVLLGSPLALDPEPGVLNAAFIVDHSGAGAAYAKRRLVPWGEYVPGKRLVPFIGKLARHAGDFTAGDDVALIDLPESLDPAANDELRERLGVAICYEVIFPRPVAAQARAGATLLVSITNDSWYGDSSAPWQHLRAARWRAAENRRPMLRAALTGVSAIIDRHGQVTRQLGVGERGVLRARLAGHRQLTPFARAPWLVVLIAGGIVAFAIMRLPPSGLDRR